MMLAVNILSEVFVSVDQAYDYVPVYSSVTNLIALFQKCVIFPLVSDLAIRANAYLSHIDQKSFARCVILLVPVLGNIVIALYDYSILQSYEREKGALESYFLREHQRRGDSQEERNLQRWVHRLFDSGRGDVGSKREQLSNVLKYLRFADQNEGFRVQFAAIIQDANTSCEDRTTLSYLHVGIAYQMATIDLHDTKALADFIKRGDLSMKKLEKCARDLIRESPMIPGSDKLRDEIEVYLAYPIMLKHKLHLPIDVERMSFFALSGVSLNNLNTAYETVSAELANEEEFYHFLASHDKWNEALALNHPTEYAAIGAARDEAVGVVEDQTLQVVGGDSIDDFAQADRYHQIRATYIASLAELTKAVLTR